MTSHDSANPITLGELIDTLRHFPPDYFVKTSSGAVGSFISWRGSYDQLSLIPSDKLAPIRVADLVAKCREALTSKFEGYKGGEYTMSLNTPVWADAWGEYGGQHIAGVKISYAEHTVTLVTAWSRQFE